MECNKCKYYKVHNCNKQYMGSPRGGMSLAIKNNFSIVDLQKHENEKITRIEKGIYDMKDTQSKHIMNEQHYFEKDEIVAKCRGDKAKGMLYGKLGEGKGYPALINKNADGMNLITKMNKLLEDENNIVLVDPETENKSIHCVEQAKKVLDIWNNTSNLEEFSKSWSSMAGYVPNDKDYSMFQEQIKQIKSTQSGKLKHFLEPINRKCYPVFSNLKETESLKD